MQWEMRNYLLQNARESNPVTLRMNHLMEENISMMDSLTKNPLNNLSNVSLLTPNGDAVRWNRLSMNAACMN